MPKCLEIKGVVGRLSLFHRNKPVKLEQPNTPVEATNQTTAHPVVVKEESITLFVEPAFSSSSSTSSDDAEQKHPAIPRSATEILATIQFEVFDRESDPIETQQILTALTAKSENDRESFDRLFFSSFYSLFPLSFEIQQWTQILKALATSKIPNDYLIELAIELRKNRDFYFGKMNNQEQCDFFEKLILLHKITPLNRLKAIRSITFSKTNSIDEHDASSGEPQITSKLLLPFSSVQERIDLLRIMLKYKSKEIEAIGNALTKLPADFLTQPTQTSHLMLFLKTLVKLPNTEIRARCRAIKSLPKIVKNCETVGEMINELVTIPAKGIKKIILFVVDEIESKNYTKANVDANSLFLLVRAKVRFWQNAYPDTKSKPEHEEDESCASDYSYSF